MQFSTSNVDLINIAGHPTIKKSIKLCMIPKGQDAQHVSHTIRGAPYPPFEYKDGHLRVLSRYGDDQLSTGWKPNGPYQEHAEQIGIHLHCWAKQHDGKFRETHYAIDQQNATTGQGDLNLVNVDGHLFNQNELNKGIEFVKEFSPHHKAYVENNHEQVHHFLITGKTPDTVPPPGLDHLGEVQMTQPDTAIDLEHSCTFWRCMVALDITCLLCGSVGVANSMQRGFRVLWRAGAPLLNIPAEINQLIADIREAENVRNVVWQFINTRGRVGVLLNFMRAMLKEVAKAFNFFEMLKILVIIGAGMALLAAGGVLTAILGLVLGMYFTKQDINEMHKVCC